VTSIQERLAGCFSAVFPNRSPEELSSATRDRIPEWDSLAAVTLLTVVQQEFQVEMDLFDLEELGSFSSILHYLTERTGGE
jgi:acyl carrier protein